MDNHAAWYSVAFEVARGSELNPALAADPWEAGGGGLVAPAMGNSQQPPATVCGTQGFKEKLPCPGTETRHATLSKSFRSPCAPAATSRSAKVPAGAL